VSDGAIVGEFDTVLDLFDEVIERAPDVEAFIERSPERRSITFVEWAAAADGLAQHLIDEGVEPGDVVSIRLPSGIDYAIAYQAVLRAGAVATGVNPRLGTAEVEHIHALTCPTYVFDGPLPEFASGDPRRRHVAHAGTDPVAIVWTGGTTGVPKGAWFDHHCLRSMALGGAPLSQPGDRRLSPLPFAHVGAMTRVWDELANVVTTVITPTPWTPEATLDLLVSEGVTVCQGVPTQYRMLLDLPELDHADLSALRLAGTGAARVPAELVAEMRERLGCPVVVRYASTESCLATGTRVDDDITTICTTVGRPNGDVELRLVAPDRTVIADTGPDHVGRVQLRSRAMMRGYWNDPERTAAAITPDGWLDTGDLGWLGDDGNLRLTGRESEMYIRGGYNVYPIEVENCLGAHDGVLAGAVVGADVDDRLGEIGVLFAVASPGSSLDLHDVRAFVKGHLADYKAPDVLVVVDELPVTPIGKIDKKALQSRADEEARRWTR